jgi:hypothetical protein
VRCSVPLPALAAATLIAGAQESAAHAVAGPRVFPVTLTLDDPGVADEITLPQVTWQRSGGSDGEGTTHEVDLGFEWDKTITEDFALGVADGYDIFRTYGGGTHAGFENVTVIGKYRAAVNAAHEFILSLGVEREFGHTGTTHTGAEPFGSTTPTLYAGKGLGDLPAGWLRPLAVTGELAYTFSDRRLAERQVADPVSGTTTTATNNGASDGWSAGISIQYSLPYLVSQVRDPGLGSFLSHLVPLVEITWSSPATAPSEDRTRWTFAPGVIYLADTFQVGLEALIPGNRAAGTNVGAVAQVHFFLDDIFPRSIGRPVL